MPTKNQLSIYQTKDGALQLKADAENETIWASQKQIAQIFCVTPQNITIHLKNIFNSGELKEESTCKESLQVQKEGNRSIKRKIKEYNLDVLISIGYRIDSVTGTNFRIWATKTLKQHITQGFTINQQRIKQNHQAFLQAVADIKLLASDNKQLSKKDILELITAFSPTWFALDRYDKNIFPLKKGSQNDIQITAKDLQTDLQKLKQELISKKEATELFAQEKKQGNLRGIMGNVFQTVFGEDAYPTTEQKAAHLLYFIVKNHPFNDGNKRSGAFAFIWFLQKMNFDFEQKITPETLATLTILIAQSNPNDKEKIIGLILLLLNKK